MPIAFRNAVVGTTIFVYTDQRGSILLDTVSDNVIPAIVAATYHQGGNFDAIPTSIMLAWKRDHKFPQDKYPGNMEYRGDLFRMWRDWVTADRSYKTLSDAEMDQLGHGMWIRGVNEAYGEKWSFASYKDDLYGVGAPIPGTSGPFKYINVSDAMPGDVIAWVTDSKQINYATVRDLSEGESVANEPIVVLDADVYSIEGQRKFSNGYPISPDFKVLLIRRA